MDVWEGCKGVKEKRRVCGGEEKRVRVRARVCVCELEEFMCGDVMEKR